MARRDREAAEIPVMDANRPLLAASEAAWAAKLAGSPARRPRRRWRAIADKLLGRWPDGPRAALQQIGPLIRLNDLASRDMGEDRPRQPSPGRRPVAGKTSDDSGRQRPARGRAHRARLCSKRSHPPPPISSDAAGTSGLGHRDSAAAPLPLLAPTRTVVADDRHREDAPGLPDRVGGP